MLNKRIIRLLIINLETMSRKSLFLFTLAMIISVTISAATKTWNGGTGTGLNWTTGSNWVGGVAPVAGDDIIFNTPGVITFSTIPKNISYNSITSSQCINYQYGRSDIYGSSGRERKYFDGNRHNSQFRHWFYSYGFIAYTWKHERTNQ